MRSTGKCAVWITRGARFVSVSRRSRYPDVALSVTTASTCSWESALVVYVMVSVFEAVSHVYEKRDGPVGPKAQPPVYVESPAAEVPHSHPFVAFTSTAPVTRSES